MGGFDSFSLGPKEGKVAFPGSLNLLKADNAGGARNVADWQDWTGKLPHHKFRISTHQQYRLFFDTPFTQHTL